MEDVGEDVIFAMNPAKLAIDDVAGAAEAMGTVLNDNLATDVEGFKRKAMQGISDGVTDVALPAINSLLMRSMKMVWQVSLIPCMALRLNPSTSVARLSFNTVPMASAAPATSSIANLAGFIAKMTSSPTSSHWCRTVPHQPVASMGSSWIPKQS